MFVPNSPLSLVLDALRGSYDPVFDNDTLDTGAAKALSVLPGPMSYPLAAVNVVLYLSNSLSLFYSYLTLSSSLALYLSSSSSQSKVVGTLE